jgi:lysophospholipid acyltransferase (LPLAT)-like uncharacterized protein
MPSLWMRLEAVAGAWLLRLLKNTIRWEVINQPPSNYPSINAFWHRNLLILTMQRIDDNVVVMVSSSRDGQLIAGPLSRLGYLPVRGSTTRQGASALKEMVRLGKTHTLGITPDGPKGPSGSIHPGLFQIALLAKIPIITISVLPCPEWTLNSWDKFRIPKPFSRIKVIYGEPLWVKDKADFHSAEAEFRQALTDLEKSIS